MDCVPLSPPRATTRMVSLSFLYQLLKNQLIYCFPLLIFFLFFFFRFDPQDKEITSSSSYGKFEVYRDSSTTRLKVNKPSIEDTGEYTLNAVNRGTRKKVELFLNVLGKLFLTVSKNLTAIRFSIQPL